MKIAVEKLPTSNRLSLEFRVNKVYTIFVNKKSQLGKIIEKYGLGRKLFANDTGLYKSSP